MSTLRINNIEAKSVPASPTLDEKIKLTNSSGNVLVHVDGKTSGITTIGINTTAGNITFDANSNVVVTGIITATKFVGTIEPTNLTVSGDLTIPDKIIHSGDTNTAIRFPAADTFSVETAGSTRLHIHSDGRFRVGTTQQPSGTVGGFQLDMGSYPGTARLSSGAGASGTTSASLGIYGSNHHANLANGSNAGASLNLYNYNTTDGNSTGVSYHNSNSLAIARILGVNISHSNRTGALVFMTSNGSHPTEKARLDSSGNVNIGVNASSNPFTYLRFGASQYGAADIRPTDEGSHKVGLAFYVDGTQDTTINPTERFRIHATGAVTKPNNPAFAAKSTGTWGHGSSTGTLDININMVEMFDVGNNYNGQIFTAPVAGKYFFSYTFQYKCTSGYIEVSLRKGVGGSYSQYGNMIMYPPQQSTTYHGPGIIGIIDLAANNTVKPVVQVNYSGNQIQNVNFSGYLLG